MGDPTNNRFYREPDAIPHAGRSGSYRDEFNTTMDYDNGFRAAVRLATVLMQKHFPDAKDWEPAPDLLGVMTQIDHITTGMVQIDRIVDAAKKVTADLAQEARQWTMDRMPAAAMDAAAKSAGADILRRRIEQTAHYDPGFARIDR